MFSINFQLPINLPLKVEDVIFGATHFLSVLFLDGDARFRIFLFYSSTGVEVTIDRYTVP